MKIKKLNHKAWASGVLLALVLMPSMAAAQFLSDVQDNGLLHLRGYGSFYEQGTVETLGPNAQGGPFPAGNVVINQLYVEFMKPQAQNGKKHFPIVLQPGGGLSNKVYETTPDGRMGWKEYFVRQGFDTYVAEEISSARSGFDGSKYNMVRNGALPVTAQGAMLANTDQVVFDFFRVSMTAPCPSSPCWASTTPIPGGQFPIQVLGVGNSGANQQAANQIQFNALSTLPNTPSGCVGGSCNSSNPGDTTWAPYAQFAKVASDIGGAILLGHSQSSGYPTAAALQPASGCFPWTSASACKVKGIIQLETGCFGNLTPAEITTLSHIPILIEYGDFSAVPQPAPPCPTEIQQITNAGGDIKFAWLPHLSPGSLYPGSPGPITGNGHMSMWEKNNLQIADLLIGWINSRGL